MVWVDWWWWRWSVSCDLCQWQRWFSAGMGMGGHYHQSEGVIEFMLAMVRGVVVVGEKVRSIHEGGRSGGSSNCPAAEGSSCQAYGWRVKLKARCQVECNEALRQVFGLISNELTWWFEVSFFDPWRDMMSCGALSFSRIFPNSKNCTGLVTHSTIHLMGSRECWDCHVLNCIVRNS